MQQPLIGGGRPHERNVPAQPGLGILLEEVDSHAAGQEKIDSIGPGRTQGGYLGGIIGLAKGGVEFTGNPALVIAFEPGHIVLAGNVVGRNDKHILISLFGGVLADNLGQVVRLPGGIEIIFIATLAGKI